MLKILAGDPQYECFSFEGNSTYRCKLCDSDVIATKK